MKKEILYMLTFAVLAMLIMSYAPEITGKAYSRTLGRTETGTPPVAKDCQANEDCPVGYACRPYGALQRTRKTARTACVPVCEDPELNRLPYDIIEMLKVQYDLNRINGFDPFKTRPTRYRPKHGFETYLYTSNCRDATTLVEPFCLDTTRDDAQVASIEVSCATLNPAFVCLEDDNGDASCGYPDAAGETNEPIEIAPPVSEEIGEEPLEEHIDEEE